jgi:hypothetical protein
MLITLREIVSRFVQRRHGVRIRHNHQGVRISVPQGHMRKKASEYVFWTVVQGFTVIRSRENVTQTQNYAHKATSLIPSQTSAFYLLTAKLSLRNIISPKTQQKPAFQNATPPITATVTYGLVLPSVTILITVRTPHDNAYQDVAPICPSHRVKTTCAYPAVLPTPSVISHRT